MSGFVLNTVIASAMRGGQFAKRSQFEYAKRATCLATETASSERSIVTRDEIASLFAIELGYK